jgi:hypothetical protein
MFAHLENKQLGTLSILGVWSNSIQINCEKLPNELHGPHFAEIENFKFKSRF